MAAALPRASAPEWLHVTDHFDPFHVAHEETVLTVCNGYTGVRGSLEMSPHMAAPGTYIAGVFATSQGRQREIVNLPCWLGLQVNMDGFDFNLGKGTVLSYWRALDVRQGMLLTDLVWRDDAKRRWRWQSARLVHKTERRVALLWGALTSLDTSGMVNLSSSLDAYSTKYGSSSGRNHYRALQPRELDGKGIALNLRVEGTAVAMASCLTVGRRKSTRQVICHEDKVQETLRVPIRQGRALVFEKRVVVYTSREARQPAKVCARDLARLRRRSISSVVRTHVRAWKQVWERSDVVIEGEAEVQRAVRWNLFHLASLENRDDSTVSIGAKGLHGNGYQGLVFWDTEIYLVPFFIYTDPEAARAQLTYRYHHLKDARQNAREAKRKGARYPWNSSDRALEHFPVFGWQEHLQGDIAYAIDQYVAATDDQQFYREIGAPLIIELAQYWVSRLTYDAKTGTYNMLDLMGPDEIHGHINNNAYTNYLTRWHLGRALEAVADLKACKRWARVNRAWKLRDADLATWERIRARIPLRFDKKRNIHEQFDGYFKLKERAIDRSMSKMQYTGSVQHSFRPSKVNQQADLMMLYYLFRQDFPRSVRRCGYEYCEPRCSHTSTLSRSVFASVAAQSGLLSEAERLFGESVVTDIGPTAECDSGIHAACMGGNWQALVMGFGGFSVQEGRPAFDPALPRRWQALRFRLQWRGKELAVTVRRKNVHLKTRTGTLSVFVRGKEIRVGPRGVRVAL